MQHKELSTKCYDNNNVPEKINFDLNATIKKIKHFSLIVYVRMWRAFFLPQNRLCIMCRVYSCALYFFPCRIHSFVCLVLFCVWCGCTILKPSFRYTMWPLTRHRFRDKVQLKKMNYSNCSIVTTDAHHTHHGLHCRGFSLLLVVFFFSLPFIFILGDTVTQTQH